MKKKLIINQLFSNGKIINSHPFRLVYLEVEEPTFVGIQLLISVPKRRFKLAVSRNRIRRLISEAFRLNSNELKATLNTASKNIAIGIIFNGQKELPYFTIEEKLQIALKKLSQTFK